MDDYVPKRSTSSHAVISNHIQQWFCEYGHLLRRYLETHEDINWPCLCNTAMILGCYHLSLKNKTNTLLFSWIYSPNMLYVGMALLIFIGYLTFQCTNRKVFGQVSRWLPYRTDTGQTIFLFVQWNTNWPLYSISDCSITIHLY